MFRFSLKCFAITAVVMAGIFLLCSPWARADEAAVAVAANFTQAAKVLEEKFEARTSHTLALSFGSSGAFYAQIKNGAPFDAFLSADALRPQKLEEEELATTGTRFTYALGKLVLWSPNQDVVDDKGAVLAAGEFDKLAIADPKTAPYGEAARQALTKLKLWDALKPKLVQGTSIGQAYQFVASGNVRLGLVAFAQIIKDGKPTGSFWLVPAKYYDPLVQQAVLLKRGESNPAATAFLEFLKSEEAVKIIKSYGYEVR